MFFRLKATGPYQYLQIAESHRQDGKVRQRILATLGRLDILKSSGQLDSLLRSGLRFSDKLAVLDAHSTGKLQPSRFTRIGPDLVFSKLWKQSGIVTVLQELLSRRQFEFDVERAIYLTVLHRLFCPGSDRAAEQWRENYRIPGAESLQLHHLYRAMAWLGEDTGEEGEIPGVPRRIKDEIEERLFDQHRDLFSEIDLVFFDTTSIYFEGHGGQTLGRHGYSKDHRPDLKQMIVGLALDIHGWPICSLLWPGNVTDSKTVLPLIQRFKKRFRVQRVSIVADRGMISKETIGALESGEMDCQYILGVRMRSTGEVEEKVLKDEKPWQEIVPERQQKKDPSPLKVKEVLIEGRRYVVCLNEEQKRTDEEHRKAIVSALKDQLKAAGAKALVGNKGYRKYLKTVEEATFEIDEGKIESEAKYDGLWVLRTNMDLETEVIAQTYKHLWTVEDMFRSMKSLLATRPIYHKRDETILGHVFCSFLALRMRRELENRMEEQGKVWEWGEIIRGLDNLSEATLKSGEKEYALRSQLSGLANVALQGAGVAVPPTLREL